MFLMFLFQILLFNNYAGVKQSAHRGSWAYGLRFLTPNILTGETQYAWGVGKIVWFATNILYVEDSTKSEHSY